jgi:hypothetical protein
VRRPSLKITITCLTFIVGVGVTLMLRQQQTPTGHRIVSKLSDEQTQAAEVFTLQVAPETERPRPVSISPYEIKRLITANAREALLQPTVLDLGPIWKQLHITTDGSEEFPSACNSNCTADIFPLELDGQDGTETLLRVGLPAWDYRYLIFKQTGAQGASGGGWTLLGHTAAHGWWSTPSHRVEQCGTERWLVIKGTGGHGSGFHTQSEDWYQVSDDGISTVLSYQTNHFAMAWETAPGLERETRVLKISYSDKATTVVLLSAASYESSGEKLRLWTNKRRATFVKEAGTRQFIFDPLHSEMSAQELDTDYGDGVRITDAEFLKYNYRQLAEIAAGRDAKRKAWLREFLDTCDDGPEKRSLQKAVAGNSSSQE